MSFQRLACPGCSHEGVSGSYAVPNQPVILNYRFPTAAAAQAVPRADIELLECANCGLIFNAAFDPALVPYDPDYENTQRHSPAFQQYLDQLAGDLINRYDLHGKRILEVGCGKGDFLKLICRLGGNEGRGYDTTYEGPPYLSDPRIEFKPEYITAPGVRESFDLVISRHVIEHVPAIGAFLKELAAIARAAGDPLILLETPRFEWIAETGSFWDVFYEHCNYFTEGCLRALCEASGLHVLRQDAVFQRQYQILELRTASNRKEAISKTVDTFKLEAFAMAARKTQKSLLSKLVAKNAAEGWAIWGAGAKGVALVNQLEFSPPSFVIDSNPAKHSCVIPGSGVPIIAPTDARILEARVIVVANPNYLDEIRSQLKVMGFRNSLISL